MPLLTLYFRWLLFRLMFGFGKMKFHGASTKEFSYLKGFMINQPLPTCLSWMIHDLPLIVHKVGLMLFFVVEIIVPFGFVFASGWIRIACGLGTIFLQMNIAATGNFGFFNLLSAVLCVTCLDGGSNFLQDFELSQIVATPLTHFVFGAILLPLTLFYLLMNSWCTMSFMYWPALNLPVTSIGNFLRLLTPWHVIHAYGIFFSQSSPSIRWVPIIEGCADEVDEDDELDAIDYNESGVAAKKGHVWKPYVYRYMTVSTRRRPPFVAPYHYRFDQSIFYDSIGMTPDTFFTSLSSGNPYDFRGDGGTNLERVAQCLLLDQAPYSPIQELFLRNPFPSSSSRPVKSIRISLYLYRSTDWATMRETGQWWRAKYAGPQVRKIMTRRSLLKHYLTPSPTPIAMTRDKKKDESTTATSDSFFQLHDPSIWHPDHYLWQQRTNFYKRVVLPIDAAIKSGQRVRLSESLASQLDTDANWDKNLIALLWNDFLPRLQGVHGRLVETIRIGAGMDATQEGACLSCQLQSAWERESSLATQGIAPVMDWSRTIEELRAEIRVRFTPNQLYFLRALTYRLVVVLIHRILHTPNLFAQPGAGSSTVKQSEEYEMMMKELEERHAKATNECKIHRSSSSPSPASKALPTVSLPAPTIAANFGLIPDTIPHGPRTRAVPTTTEDGTKDALPLPSFFHLHLFAMHALLSCKTEADFIALLISPSRVVAHRPSFALSIGLIPVGVFHSDLLRFQSDKVRLTHKITFPAQRETGGILPGWLDVYFAFLPYQFIHANQPPGPTNIQRPMASDQFWKLDTQHMQEPIVDLDA